MNTTVADIYVSPTEIDISRMDPTKSPVMGSVTSVSASPIFQDFVTFDYSNSTSKDAYDKYKGKEKKKCYVPDGWDPKPNTTLMSIILTFGTFFIAFFIRKIRNSRLLGRTVSDNLQLLDKCTSNYNFVIEDYEHGL